MGMKRNPGPFVTAVLLLDALLATETAFAQKPGGVLKVYHRDSPASMSILEEATNSTEIPMMGVFNNLVIYKQDVPQNSLQSIIPDLASDWAWNEDGSELTFRLRGVSSGTTAIPSPPMTSNAPGTCCSASRLRNCAPIRARRGIRTSKRSLLTPI